jgi:hypothetical protein
VPIVDHHNHIFSREGCRVALLEDLIDFYASSERPRGYEILHHAIVPELVLDGAGMARASLLKELLKVIYGWPLQTLATVFGSRGAHRDRVACLFPNAAIICSRGCGLLVVLFVPLLAALGALLGVLDDDVG